MPAVMDNNPAAFPKPGVGKRPSGCVFVEMSLQTGELEKLAVGSKERPPQELQ
jgi:hypothetical protein